MKKFLVPVLGLATLLLVGCGSSDADTAAVPAKATQGGPSNVNPAMKDAIRNGATSPNGSSDASGL